MNTTSPSLDGVARPKRFFVPLNEFKSDTFTVPLHCFKQITGNAPTGRLKSCSILPSSVQATADLLHSASVSEPPVQCVICQLIDEAKFPKCWLEAAPESAAGGCASSAPPLNSAGISETVSVCRQRQ